MRTWLVWLLMLCLLVHRLKSKTVNLIRGNPLTINKESILCLHDSKIFELNTKGNKTIPLVLPWLSDGVKSGLASGLSAALVKAILQPFDTIKTVQQAERFRQNAWNTGVSVVRARGICGLWSGIGITVLGSSPSVAVYFGLYSAIKSKLIKVFPSSMKLPAVAISAAIGNTVASVLRVPYELIKQRLQTGQFTNTFEAIVYSIRNEGFVGIFGNGRLQSQIMRDVPYAVVTLASYELLQSLSNSIISDINRRSILSNKDKGNKSLNQYTKLKNAICGSVAGGIGSFVTTPMDVVKTRLMTSTKYTNIVQAVITIAKDEGMSTFFAGTLPRLIHKIPANGLFFLWYEFFKSVLGVVPPVHCFEFIAYCINSTPSKLFVTPADESLTNQIKSGVSRGELTYLIVRCFAVHVSQDAVFKNIGTLSNLFVFATTSSVKNERRYIRVNQSIPFLPNGSNSSSIFDTIYESEIIEDQQDMSSSLLIPIQCPKDMDCKLQVHVFYSSNRTNGKEVLLCDTTIIFREMMNVIKQQILDKPDQKSLYQLTMSSEYCLAAKLYLEVFLPFEPLFKLQSLQIESPYSDKNPIKQHYVFYSDEDTITPRVDVCEITSEPRLSFIISELFLSNVSDAIERSLASWKDRYHFERMRQGRFICREEALLRGWHEIRVSVLRFKLATTREVPSSAPLVSLLDNNNNFSSPKVSGSKGNNSVNQGSVSAHPKRGSGLKNKKINESLPSTFVNVSVVDSSQTFTISMGRTNTEYFTTDAVYGSNINAQYSKKPNTIPVADPDVTVERLKKLYNFSVIESQQESKPSVDSRSGSSDLLSVEGEEISFVRYIPHRKDSTVEFEVFAVDSSGKSDSIGKCQVPLDNDELSMWVPLELSTDYKKFYDSACLQIMLTVSSDIRESISDVKKTVSSLSGINKYIDSSLMSADAVYIAPAELDEVFDFDRSTNGQIEGVNNCDISLDYRHVISNCYSWLWYLGYADSDPLRSRSQSNPLSKLNLNDSSIQVKRSHRVDCPFSLNYLVDYITKLETLASEVVVMRSDVAKAIRSGSTFRPSTQKKVAEVQPLPINLHYQFFVVRPHDRPSAPVDIEASLTCGSLSPHSLGHKKGGLYLQQNEVHMMRRAVNETKHLCKLEIKSCGNRAISVNHSSYQTRIELMQRVMRHDLTMVGIAQRRILALSQGLSVVLNAFLLKISLVAEGHLSASSADQWRDYGFLVVFQGLLSVIGNEKSMLEDTLAVVEALHLYKIRVLVSPHDSDRKRAASLSDDNDNPSNSRPHSARIKANVPLLGTETHIQHISFEGREIVVYLHGEVIDRLPESYKSDAYSSGVVIGLYTVLFSQGIDMQQSVASAFTVETSSNGVMFQGELNMRGLKQLNRYCHVIQPLNSHDGFEMSKSTDVTIDNLNYSKSNSNKQKHKLIHGNNLNDEHPDNHTNSSNISNTDNDNHIHPLMYELTNTITSKKVHSKNVDMIAEVERVTQILRGCKVTFCKSGKDRTGMAVTFEQARQLSERFAIGSTLSSIINNANLMRIYGTRLLIAEKNIGRKVYSINKLQAQFLPIIYRPPAVCCEDLMKKDTS
eukprot:gene18865-24650_t